LNHQQAFQREVVAYHQAGHVVIAFFLGYKPKSVAIVPAHDSDYPNPLRGLQLDSDGSDRARLTLERAIQICLAGPRAQKKFRGVHSNWTCGHDDQARELGLRVCGGSAAQSNAFLRWLDIRTAETVDAHWATIEHVAKRLLARDRLNRAELLALILEA